jgi:hypothetical protein
MPCLRGTIILLAIASASAIARADSAIDRLAQPVRAQAPEPPPIPPSNTLDIYFDPLLQSYAEVVDDPSLKSTQLGVLPGFRLDYEHVFPKGPSLGSSEVGLGGSFSGLWGRTGYVGTTWDGAPLSGPTDNQILDLEFLASWRVPSPFGDPWRVYGGFAWHSWSRDTRPVGPSGYREQYDWYLLRVGVEYSVYHREPLAVAVDLTATWNVGGTITGYLSDVDPSAGVAKSTLGMGFGARLEVPLRWTLTRLLVLQAVPWFEYLPIGQGAVALSTSPSGFAGTAVQEPTSNTLFFGLLVGPRLAF